jgi:hypothetical protein
VNAALNQFIVLLSNTSPATSTAVLFSFKPGVSVPGGSKIRLSFHPSFTVPASPLPSDAQFLLDDVAQPLGAVQSTTTNGYAAQAGFLTLTIASGTTLGAASSVRFTVGRNGGLVTPGAEGDYGVSARILSPTGAQLNVNSSYLVIRQSVTLSAAVSSTSPQVVIRWATPELRVGAAETNDDATFYLTVRTSADNDNAILYTSPTLATTTEAGTYYTTTTLTGIGSGTYDVGIKTHQHLTKLIQNVSLAGNTTTILNFTNTTNLATKGSQRLASGDVSGAGTSPATLGDDVVNSIDLSLLINRLDLDDLTGNVERVNLNQDPVINSVDLSMLLFHLDQEGERYSMSFLSTICLLGPPSDREEARTQKGPPPGSPR